MSSSISKDVMLNIFERLPPKSIVRFRSVSKSLCSRLASAGFIHKYNLRSLNDHTREKVLVRQRVYKEEDFKDIYTLHLGDPELSLDQHGKITGIELPYHDAKIIGSCNGVICLLKSREFSLWNFSIRRKLDVPHNPSSRAFMVSGFGFDPVTNDYKIVSISYGHNKGTACNGNNSFIYSIKRDSWNMISPPTIPLFKVESNACFFNENLHWVVLTDWSSRIILTFSLTSFVFSTIELPEPITQARQLTIINGSLALISWADDHTWVWLMSQSHNVVSWSALYKHKTNKLDVVRIFQPVLNGDLLKYGTEREVYNSRTQLVTKFLDFGPCHGLEIERHVESLEFLDKRVSFGKTIVPSMILNNHKRQFSSLSYDDNDYDGGDGDDDDHDHHHHYDEDDDGGESHELLDKRTTFGKTIIPSTILSNHKRQVSTLGDDDDDDDDADDDDDDDKNDDGEDDDDDDENDDDEDDDGVVDVDDAEVFVESKTLMYTP